MNNFADKVVHFYKSLAFKGTLPVGISVLNPFKEHADTLRIASEFYHKFYNDTHKRHLIMGINPGRFGGAVTGIPFTDTKRLKEKCGIEYHGKITHEPSSVFVYEMMDAFGGIKKFCSRFYINSLFPLTITTTGNNGKEVNYNYYDSEALKLATRNTIITNIRKQLSFGIYTNTCFCLGTGKNEQYFQKLNNEFHFFDRIIALEHPRYIMQYKLKEKQRYIDKYLAAFEQLNNTGTPSGLLNKDTK